MAFASVFPLVTARAVAREFTYEVEEGVGVGAIVRVPFGRSRARGIVTRSSTRRPPGVDARPIEAVIGQIPPALVELALWLADYYGSTPARALALVAPEMPKRRKEQAPPAERQSLSGEAEPLELSPPQIAAVERIVNGQGNFLLYGATGSGKTEVYLQAIASMLERGFGAIVLVPEIALAPQTVGRVRARFGENVAILHSGLTDAERRDERERIASGEARIVVGARSAIFAPVRGLGLIVVDEEHDPSYKQDSDPRYDARTVAAKRAALEGAVAVYGSATPRPETWAALEHLDLGGRLGARPAAGARDRPAPRGRLSALGAAAQRAAQGRRASRQGDPAAQPARHRAGAALPRVRHDDPLPELRRRARSPRRLSLRCHHCGYTTDAPSNCPACGSPDLARLGAGTQKLERELARELPELELIRLDADAVAKPEQLAPRLQRFARDRRRRPARHADGREGAPLQRRRARGGDRRRHRSRDAGLPRRGADVSADHAARRPQRARCTGARARPDVPAGRARRSRMPRGTTSGGSSPRSSSGARRSTTRRTRISCGSS